MIPNGEGEDGAPGRVDPQPKLIRQGRFEWERILRRVKIPVEPDPTRRKAMAGATTVKAIAFAAATYSDPDGSSVRPGVERLAAVTGFGEVAVTRALRQLVALGLLDQVVVGSRQGRRAWASEYHLTIPEDLLDRLELLPPDELDAEHRSPATCEQPADHRSPATTDPDEVAAEHRSPATTDLPEHRSPATRTQVAGDPPPDHYQPQQPPDQQWPRTAVTRPTRETAWLWTAKSSPGLGSHPARGVARIGAHAASDAEPGHPRSAVYPTAVDASVTQPLPALPDPRSLRRPTLRLVHSRRPA